MRMIETFKKGPFKFTIFQTDQRYLLQAEDQTYILSWKVSKEIPYKTVKEEAVKKLFTEAEDIWPQLNEKLHIQEDENASGKDFPQII